MASMANINPPRLGTKARAIFDLLVKRPKVDINDAIVEWHAQTKKHEAAPNGVARSVRNVLERYGESLGFGEWRLKDEYRPQPTTEQHTCESFEGMDGGGPPSAAAKAKLTLVRLGALTPPPAQDEIGKTPEQIREMHAGSCPLGSLVRYSGPLLRDRGIVGRVTGLDGTYRREVKWVTGGGTTNEDISDLTFWKMASTNPDPQEASSSPFKAGDNVEYVGPLAILSGKKGEVLATHDLAATVNWGDGMGTSTESYSNLRFVPSPPAFVPGDTVEVRKNGLTFPAKVMLGPMSNGTYKVICPNGVHDWAYADMMRRVKEGEVRNAIAPQKPEYEGTPAESERTRDIRRQLEESLEKDRLDHWAKKTIEGMKDGERLALLRQLIEQYPDEAYGAYISR